MKKYGIATYGTRKKSKNISSQVKFDLAVAVNLEKTDSEGSSQSSENSSERTRKSHVTKREQSISQANKKRKVVPLYKDDLFGFTEDDYDSNIKPGNKIRRKTLKEKIIQSPKKTVIESGTDCTDKSTDDEAYGSSQEPHGIFSKEIEADIEANNVKPIETKRQSPFKHFLKNNVVSLSPKKIKNSDHRRFSALPTNIWTSDEDLSDCQQEDMPSSHCRSSASEAEMLPSTSRVRVKREEKQLFTVVRNVKHKHACLEDGETQQFFDDVDFALDGLRKELSIAARCSSALELAVQCSVPSFRVNLRAHGVISKIFDALKDAPSNKTLGLCTSFIFYMITRDSLKVDFDSTILDLLLKLLCVSENNDKSKLVKKSVHEAMVKRVRKILTRLAESSTCYLDMDNLSSASLARESLLSLTSQRAGEWFKEEVRTLGGLEYIVNIVLASVKDISDNSEGLLQNEREIENIERCLKLIENVTFQNRENQLYLVSCKKSSLIVALARLMKVLINGIIENRLSSLCVFFKNVLDCLKSILRVFLNLTHDNNGESETIGQQTGLISGLLLSVLKVPQFLVNEEQFDILVLALGLLINLVEHSKQNIASLIVLKTPLSYEGNKEVKESNKTVPAIEALVHLFKIREEAARKTETMAYEATHGSNNELKPTKDGLGWVCGDDIDVSREEEDEEETRLSVEDQKNVGKERTLEDEIEDALQKAGKHMEDSMVASYVALLLGCIAQGNKRPPRIHWSSSGYQSWKPRNQKAANQNLIRELLPDNNFDVLINTLQTFLGFMKLTSGTTGQAIERIIDVLKAC